MAKESMYGLARMILHNQCPPDNKMYLCNMGEEDECSCTECWENYLIWALNNYKGDPYKMDKIKESEII
jgi:hypothetical protein